MSIKTYGVYFTTMMVFHLLTVRCQGEFVTGFSFDDHFFLFRKVSRLRHLD